MNTPNFPLTKIIGRRPGSSLLPAIALLAALHLFSAVTQAKYIGADPAPTQVVPSPADASGTAISLTEGNLTDRQTFAVVNPNGSLTHGLAFSAAYNSRDADGSHVQLDTVMGYGWTHSFNVFLFNQLGSMVRC